MKKIKKMLTVLTATAMMAMGVTGLSANAATRNFTVGSYTATASVSFASVNNTYYGASTSCSSKEVTYRYVSVTGKDSNGSTISNTGYSFSGTASASVYAVNHFVDGSSYHYASYTTSNGSTASGSTTLNI